MDEFSKWLQEKQETHDIHIVSTLYIDPRSCAYIFYEEFEKGHRDIQLVQIIAQEQNKHINQNRFADLEVV